MQLDLAAIRRPETPFDASYAPEQLGPATPDYAVAAPVRLAMIIFKEEARVRLAGRVATVLEVACSRCLEPFAFAVDSAFDLRYAPLAAAGGAEEIEIAGDELSVAFYDGESIDLAQLVQEQFYLALPMKPLCRVDCRGLCPSCGANRNEGGCACELGWADPRLAALRRLLEDSTMGKRDDA